MYRAGHPVSTLMAWRWLRGAPMSRQWIDFSAISPFLPRVVVAAEDSNFCKHDGIDWGALREVIDSLCDAAWKANLPGPSGVATVPDMKEFFQFAWTDRQYVMRKRQWP